MEPVKGTADGKPCVLERGVRAVPDQSVDPIFIGWQPSGVKVANDGGSVNEVRPMEAFEE